MERRAGVLRGYESDWNSRRRAERAGVVGTDGGRARRRRGRDLRHQQHGGDHRPGRPAAAGSPEGLRARGRADHRRGRRASARLGAARRRVLLGRDDHVRALARVRRRPGRRRRAAHDRGHDPRALRPAVRADVRARARRRDPARGPERHRAGPARRAARGRPGAGAAVRRLGDPGRPPDADRRQGRHRPRAHVREADRRRSEARRDPLRRA